MEIKLGYSECPSIQDKKNLRFNSFKECDQFLAFLPVPDLGYYKTDFYITIDDEVYEGRFDLDTDHRSLKNYVLRMTEYYSSFESCRLFFDDPKEALAYMFENEEWHKRFEKQE